MKIWTWERLEKEFEKYPEQLKAFQKLGSDYPTFDHWLNIDLKKCDIVAKVIGCQRTEDLKEQQRENIEYRRSACSTPNEWLKKFSSDPEHRAQIRRIAKRFARQKRCHRNYESKKAGIRCYCDKHNH